MNPLDTALEYAGRGWPVFPCHTVDETGKCSCVAGKHKDAGKHPRTDHGFKDATADANKIGQWWTQWPDANVAIRTGRKPGGAGFFVLDIDPRHNGDKTFDELTSKHGTPPDTVEAATGGGGRHLLFKYPPERQIICRSNVKPGIDVRGDNGYIIAPPSRHTSGGVYRWLDGKGPESHIAESPAWLLALVGGSEGDLTEATPFSPSSLSLSVSLSSLLSPTRERVQQLLNSTQPTGPGVRNRLLLDLARALKFDPELTGRTAADFKPLVREWHTMALPIIGTKDFDDTWSDFRNAFEKAHTPPNSKPVPEAFTEARRRHASGNLTPEAKEYDSEGRRVLCLAVQHLGRAGDVFFLSTRDAGRHLGVTHVAASRYLHDLEADDVLVCVKRGEAGKRNGKATRYRLANHGDGVTTTGVDAIDKRQNTG